MLGLVMEKIKKQTQLLLFFYPFPSYKLTKGLSTKTFPESECIQTKLLTGLRKNNDYFQSEGLCQVPGTEQWWSRD